MLLGRTLGHRRIEFPRRSNLLGRLTIDEQQMLANARHQMLTGVNDEALRRERPSNDDCPFMKPDVQTFFRALPSNVKKGARYLNRVRASLDEPLGARARNDMQARFAFLYQDARARGVNFGNPRASSRFEDDFRSVAEANTSPLGSRWTYT